VLMFEDLWRERISERELPKDNGPVRRALPGISLVDW
jgi:hypothetical protein